MRIYALVTFDLAAWLPTPCAGWSYYHTLLMATLLPLYLVLVVALVAHSSDALVVGRAPTSARLRGSGK